MEGVGYTSLERMGRGEAVLWGLGPQRADWER